MPDETEKAIFDHSIQRRVFALIVEPAARYNVFALCGTNFDICRCLYLGII